MASLLLYAKSDVIRNWVEKQNSIRREVGATPIIDIRCPTPIMKWIMNFPSTVELMSDLLRRFLRGWPQIQALFKAFI